MTGVKCGRCGQFWTINTLWPDNHAVTSRICPDCVPAILRRVP